MPIDRDSDPQSCDRCSKLLIDTFIQVEEFKANGGQESHGNYCSLECASMRLMVRAEVKRRHDDTY